MYFLFAKIINLWSVQRSMRIHVGCCGRKRVQVLSEAVARQLKIMW